MTSILQHDLSENILWKNAFTKNKTFSEISTAHPPLSPLLQFTSKKQAAEDRYHKRTVFQLSIARENLNRTEEAFLIAKEEFKKAQENEIIEKKILVSSIERYKKIYEKEKSAQ